MTAAEPALPDFAAERAEVERYAVECESRTHDDGDRIRIRDVVGAPLTLMLLVLVRAANADRWLLDKHSDHGSELLFVLVPTLLDISDATVRGVLKGATHGERRHTRGTGSRSHLRDRARPARTAHRRRRTAGGDYWKATSE